MIQWQLSTDSHEMSFLNESNCNLTFFSRFINVHPKKNAAFPTVPNHCSPLFHSMDARLLYVKDRMDIREVRHGITKIDVLAQRSRGICESQPVWSIKGPKSQRKLGSFFEHQYMCRVEKSINYMINPNKLRAAKGAQKGILQQKIMQKNSMRQKPSVFSSFTKNLPYGKSPFQHSTPFKILINTVDGSEILHHLGWC